MKSNPILKQLKEGDIVLTENPSHDLATCKQMIKLRNIKYHPIDDKHMFDWLDFEGDILYTNIKLHKSLLNQPIGNCMSITEIICDEQIEQLARLYDMWKADEYMLTDSEFKYKQQMANMKFKS